MEMPANPDEKTLRDRAVTRLRKRREFSAHLVAYVAVNAILILVWATMAGGGFFWPVFPIAGWGIGVFFHGWDVYRAEPLEDDIRREMERMQGR